MQTQQEISEAPVLTILDDTRVFIEAGTLEIYCHDKDSGKWELATKIKTDKASREAVQFDATASWIRNPNKGEQQ